MVTGMGVELSWNYSCLSFFPKTEDPTTFSLLKLVISLKAEKETNE